MYFAWEDLCKVTFCSACKTLISSIIFCMNNYVHNCMHLVNKCRTVCEELICRISCKQLFDKLLEPAKIKFY